jgi:phosphoserine aminotransferase
MNRIYNFSPGPAILPEPVLAEASRGVLEIAGSGMSILEVSHRGKQYEAIHRETQERLLRIMGLNASETAVLFLGGGASLQFAMAPMNFLGEGRTADYVIAGEWGVKAAKEARRFGTVHVAGASEDRGYSYIPKSLDLTPGAAYVHVTTNNTIEGTTLYDLPDTGDAPLVADASSDILSRRVDFTRFSLLYAGAQKNLGPAGVTVVVARRSFLARANADLPAMLAYQTHLKSDSLYNTPPVFGVYVVGLVLKWIEEQGGLDAVEKTNREKAEVVYAALDRHADVYEPTVTEPADRSLMNITFRLRDTAREGAFLDGAKARRLEGLKGHRSVGGFRASMYNAFPLEGARVLADYLDAFARGEIA